MSRDRSENRPAQAPGMLTILNAVENASRAPITPAAVVAILEGKGGVASHIRAIFSDVSLRVLEQVGAVSGIDLDTILAAYGKARETVAAANPELDRALTERW